MDEKCDDGTMSEILALMQSDEKKAIEKFAFLLESFPKDARLYFLRGSMMIERGEHIRAHNDLSIAVEIDPEFIMARFQFGLFQLTSGEPNKAQETWAPLETLPDEHYMRKFIKGLNHLIRDEFTLSLNSLVEAVEANTEFQPLNVEMQTIIDKVRELIQQSQQRDKSKISDSEISVTSFILNQGN